MNSLQKLIIRLLPSKWSVSIEAESRSWIARCPSCGMERSIWDLGGVRWKAAGSPSMLFRCPGCGKTSMHPVTRQKS